MSVAVRLVVEREREINDFLPSEYWSIGGIFTARWKPICAVPISPSGWVDFADQHRAMASAPRSKEKWLAENEAFNAELVEIAGKKFEAGDKKQARKAAELLGFVVDKENTTEDKDAKGPAKSPTTFTGHLDHCPRFTVRSIEKKRTTSKPPAPFITSTLQQAASRPVSDSVRAKQMRASPRRSTRPGTLPICVPTRRTSPQRR